MGKAPIGGIKIESLNSGYQQWVWGLGVITYDQNPPFMKRGFTSWNSRKIHCWIEPVKLVSWSIAGKGFFSVEQVLGRGRKQIIYKPSTGRRSSELAMNTVFMIAAKSYTIGQITLVTSCSDGSPHLS